MIATRSLTLRAAACAAALAGAFATSPARADAIDDQVLAAYNGLSEEMCFRRGLEAPEVFDLTYRPDFEGATDVEYRFYKFFCGSGAYNRFDVFFSWTEYEGVQQVAFAAPSFDTNCRMGGFENFDCIEVLDVTVTGMRAVNQIVNAQFDPATRTLTENACWRGVCDASSVGVWQFREGAFVLVTFDIDPTYDGEIDLIRIVDYGPIDTGPARPTK
ncbi:MAG: hypothetical protein ACWA6X_07340 [Bauldia sp.]|jgi:hypothetical protein